MKRPSQPAVKSQNWVGNPIDGFILAKLEKVQLKPSGPADPRALIRRLYFDLTGLPPQRNKSPRLLKNRLIRVPQGSR
ncbi:MAG: hypothetical protein Ct9H300mP32_3050 [Verrucomicrobiota bacterium]|nr:MAG: hypothetical protein Ct9H300mP32_3050 [Verrucomicrobiota bacterium]